MTEKNWVEAEVGKISADQMPPVEPPVVDEPLEPLQEPAKPAEKPAESVDPKEPKTVDIRALHEERGKRKEIEKTLRQKEIEFAAAQERLNMIVQAWEAGQKEQQQKPAEQGPDQNVDPFGHLQWQLEQERRARQAIEQKLQQQQGYTEQQRQIAQVQTAYSQAAQTFAAQNQDFQQAYQHLWKELDQDLADRGMADPEQRRQMLLRDEVSFAHQMLSQGKNPAEVIYHWSKRRGYQAKTPGPANAQPNPAGNGLQDAIADIELQNKRNAAATSLSNAGGKPPSNVTLKDIASMGPDEFMAATKGKNWDKLFRSA